MLPARPPSWSNLGIVGLLLTVFFGQCFFASQVKSPAWDEPAHIAAGLSYLQTGVFRVNLQHPPLLKELSGLSLWLSGSRWPHTARAQELLSGVAQFQWSVGNDILMAGGVDRTLFWARLPLMLLATLLGALLYIWGRQLVGSVAALGALFLFALDPTVVAHSYLVTTDVGFAAFTLLFFFALWSYLQRRTRLRLVLCGLAMGLVLGAKFSALLLLPVAGMLLLASDLGPHNKAVRAAGAFAIMFLLALVVIQALYFFRSGLMLYLKGLLMVYADHDPNYLVYLAGQMRAHFLTYFAVAYLLKEPIASIVLVAIGLFVLLRGKSSTIENRLFLLLPPAALFVGHSLLAANLGIRYIIPVLPFAYLIGGIGFATLIAAGARWKRVLAVVLAAWCVLAAAGIHPDQLSYFNETACLDHPGRIGLDGGSQCGTAWLDDSNVDWGEGLKQLKTWMEHHANGRTIRLGYFGSFPPAAYGIPHEIISGAALVASDPTPGLYAVSAHLVAHLTALVEREGHGSEWLRNTRPIDYVGHAFYIYEIPTPPTPANGS